MGFSRNRQEALDELRHEVDLYLINHTLEDLLVVISKVISKTLIDRISARLYKIRN